MTAKERLALWDKVRNPMASMTPGGWRGLLHLVADASGDADVKQIARSTFHYANDALEAFKKLAEE